MRFDRCQAFTFRVGCFDGTKLKVVRSDSTKCSVSESHVFFFVSGQFRFFWDFVKILETWSLLSLYFSNSLENHLIWEFRYDKQCLSKCSKRILRLRLKLFLYSLSHREKCAVEEFWTRGIRQSSSNRIQPNWLQLSRLRRTQAGLRESQQSSAQFGSNLAELGRNFGVRRSLTRPNLPNSLSSLELG